MHELALSQNLIELIEQEARERGFERVLEIRLRVGEYSGIIPECIKEFFPIAAEGTRAEKAELIVEWLPAVFGCRDCGYEGAVERKDACCPRCRSLGIRMVSGREFFVDSLKVE